jgi:hypothetical protein
MGLSAGDDIGGVLGERGGGLLYVLAKGTASLAVAVLAYPLPFLLIFLLIFGGAAWRGFKTRASVQTPVVQPVPDSALIGTVIGVAIALHWLLVPLAGATQFLERLLQPALLILPVYLFMLVERGLERSPLPARAIRNYALALAAVAVVALLARVGVHAAGGDYCRRACRDLLPVADIAAGLRSAGFSGKGTIVVRDLHLGGNLRVQFPEARVMATGHPVGVWPKPAGAGQCLAIWSEYTGPVESTRANVYGYLGSELGVLADAKPREGVVTVRYPRSQRAYRLFYGLYDAPLGDCR